MQFNRWSVYANPIAANWTYRYTTDISLAQEFHKSVPDFAVTPLVPLDKLATELNIRKVFVKDESSRLGLPAFKILGASWGTFRVIAAHGAFPLDTPLAKIANYARKEGLVLFTATDGNHGRAVARMAKILGIKARVFVPKFTDFETRNRIASEGADVTIVQGDYDAAVAEAYDEASVTAGLFIQDTSFHGYEEIPAWIVEGYSTMLRELEQQLDEQGLEASVVVTPIGVGSLGHAVVSHCKSSGRAIRVLAIEPETSACLHASLKAGKMTTIETSTTIMDGMNCGTVSPISWPILREGVDASVTISDLQSHQAVQYLHAHGVGAGPCGAGSLAGFQRVATEAPEVLGLTPDSVVVLLCTEGARGYPVPKDV